MVQEHNFRLKHKKMVERMAGKKGFAAFVAYLPSHIARGGAAIFATLDHPDLDCSEHVFTGALDSAVASVIVKQAT
eukprot:4921579-Prymnesium_polylepis.1